MPQENVETVRELNAAFNRDPADTQAWLHFYDPEVEFHMPPEWPEERLYRGWDGLRDIVSRMTEVFGSYRWEGARLLDADDRVVGLWHHRGQVEGGPVLEREVGTVFYFRGNRIIRVLGFFSWREALEAAGLRE